MEKPQTVKRAEMTQGLYNVINAAQLPAFVVADTLRQLLADVEALAQQQFESDLRQYNEALQQEQEEQEEQEEEKEEESDQGEIR